MTPRQAPLPIAVLASGRGSNLQALLDSCQRPGSPARICAVLSDRASAAALERARAAGVAAEHVDPAAYATRRAYDLALAQRLRAHGAGLVVLAGFMRILDAAMVAQFAGRMLNIHPSLLPRYPGLHTHRRVLEAGDAQHGATVHFVTDALDAGPAVLQYRLGVYPWDTPETLAARVQHGEHRIYPLAVRWFATGRLRMDAGQTLLDERPLRAPPVLTADGCNHLPTSP